MKLRQYRRLVDKDGKGGWKIPSGKGQRLIVLHAGGIEGWVEWADLVYRLKTNSAEYQIWISLGSTLLLEKLKTRCPPYWRR